MQRLILGLFCVLGLLARAHAGCMEDFPPDGCDTTATTLLDSRTGLRSVGHCYCPFDTPLSDNINVEVAHVCLDDVECRVRPRATTFANLSTPTPVDGDVSKCTDCTPTNPAAGSGTGDTLCFYNGTTFGCWRPPLTGTTTFDFLSATGPSCSADTTLTVTGAASGDRVDLGVPAAPAGSMFFAWVSSSNTVSIRHCCFTGTCNPVSQVYTVAVWH